MRSVKLMRSELMRHVAWARKAASLAALLLVQLCFAGLTTGCLYQGDAVTVDREQLRSDPSALRVDVPMVRQQGDKDCGAAALASILEFWGESVSQTEIRRTVGVSDDQPLPAGTLQRYLASRGYESFLIHGTLADLRRELQLGRPVLVGMLKPYAGRQYLAHYEVVTGISKQHVYTMNPGSSLERYPTKGFEREWSGAKHLTLIVAPAAVSTVASRTAPSPARPD